MKIILTISRWAVGLLFIFSGLVKANDPSGLSFKMQEFFEAWGLLGLHSFSLPLAVVMNLLEVVAGIGLIIGRYAKFFTAFLLLLITFFTFLTAYVLFSGKIKACGCLGDCLPLTPIQTFAKDVILLLLAVLLFANWKKLQPILPSLPTNVFLIISIVGVMYFQWHVLNYLPFVDCLPYKVGNNIPELMKQPIGATPDVFAYEFEYKKNGKTISFPEDKLPENIDADSTYEFVGRKEKLIQKGNGLEAKIVDFTLVTTTGNDTTKALMNSTDTIICVFIRHFPEHNAHWESTIQEKLWDKLLETKHQIYVVTADVEQAAFIKNKDVKVLKCDDTVIKTAARVNPTYFIFYKGTIIQKFSYLNAEKKLPTGK